MEELSAESRMGVSAQLTGIGKRNAGPKAQKEVPRRWTAPNRRPQEDPSEWRMRINNNKSNIRVCGSWCRRKNVRWRQERDEELVERKVVGGLRTSRRTERESACEERVAEIEERSRRLAYLKGGRIEETAKMKRGGYSEWKRRGRGKKAEGGRR